MIYELMFKIEDIDLILILHIELLKFREQLLVVGSQKVCSATKYTLDFFVKMYEVQHNTFEIWARQGHNSSKK